LRRTRRLTATRTRRPHIKTRRGAGSTSSSPWTCAPRTRRRSGRCAAWHCSAPRTSRAGCFGHAT
jgi:hypothetical protein